MHTHTHTFQCGLALAPLGYYAAAPQLPPPATKSQTWETDSMAASGSGLRTPSMFMVLWSSMHPLSCVDGGDDAGWFWFGLVVFIPMA